MITLSKSEYMMFLKHPAWLWLKKNDKKKLPEPDANLQALFDAGNLFEDYGEARFDKIDRIGFDSYDQYLSMPARTQKAIDEGSEVLSQGRFETSFDDQKITCIVDVIQKVGIKTFDLYEIKSSTKVKPEHIYDLAFQTVVLEKAGYKVRNVFVIYCNNLYVRQGRIDPLKMSVQEDVTTKVRSKIDSTMRNISAALKTAVSANMPDPTPRRAKLGSYRDWLDIFLSLKPQADASSIYKLAQALPEQIGQLEDMHIVSLLDIPDDFELKDVQLRQVEANKSKLPSINTDKITKFVESLEYPLYFLDYETLSSIVPPFDGTKPYEQLPFQYSLHIIAEPGADLEHKEFLHTLDTNPIPELMTALSTSIGPKGTVLVWYEGFEKKCNERMARILPEYAGFLEDVNSRIIDLMVPFKNGYYVDKAFEGSASIKKVLPVVAPELSYGDMEIQEGGSAQRLWMQSVYEDIHSQSEVDKIMADLLQYCELDTYAMVRIFEFLLAISEGQIADTVLEAETNDSLSPQSDSDLNLDSSGPAEQMSLL